MLECINDEKEKEDRSIVIEATAFAILGVLSSALTVYLLSFAGIFV